MNSIRKGGEPLKGKERKKIIREAEKGKEPYWERLGELEERKN